MCEVRLGTDRGPDHFPRQYRARRDRCRSATGDGGLSGQAPFALGSGIASALLELDSRNIAGEARPASINRALPINFVGGPDTVVEQIRRCRELTGAGIIDLGFNTPGTADPKAHMAAVELFGRKVLPRIRDI